MINLTKRLFANIPAGRGLVLIRFPWSLVSIPLILMGWFHFSDQSDQDAKARPGDVQTAGMAGRVYARFGERRFNRHGERPQGTIVPASASDAASDDGLPSENSSNSDEPSGAQDANTRCRTKVVGEWEDDYQGKRHLTVNENGSGTMVVELDGIGKKLFAATLSFDLEWSVDDGRIVMKTLGGEPKSKVQMVLKLYGSEAEYKILELTNERMLLLDGDGKTKYDWRRPAVTATE